MRFQLVITCDNDAFENPGPAHEVARILRAAANLVESHPDAEPGWTRTARDANGNTVGHYGFLADDPNAPGN